MARGIRDDRPLPGQAEERRRAAADARDWLRNASLEEIAAEYTTASTRQRDRLVAEVRRRGTSNEAWQAAFTPRNASTPSAAGTGNS